MKSYLESSLKNTGIISCSDQLQKVYLPKPFESHANGLKELLKGFLGLSLLAHKIHAEDCYALNIVAVLLLLAEML